VREEGEREKVGEEKERKGKRDGMRGYPNRNQGDWHGKRRGVN
jgi:hypothetical protein